jgi:cytochrome c-type biogenesis protein
LTAGTVLNPDISEDPRPLWRHPAFGGTLALSVLVVLTVPLWQQPIELALLGIETPLAAKFSTDGLGAAGLLLIPLAGFGFGMLASLSPCILPLIPLNLAYIGATGASGRRALGLSSRFVLGSALALSVLGLFADVAGFLMIDHRGPLLLIAGLAMMYFGLAVLDLVSAPLPASFGAGRRLGPIAAGAAFALVTTPCSSPLLAAVLSAAAAQAKAGLSVVTMLSFSLGYTLLVFLGGVFGGGLVAWTRRFDFAAPRAAAAALLVASGVTFVFTGATWF